MPLGLWNVEFLNQNAQRSYPLSALASKEDTTGSIKLPTSFLLGLRMPINVGLSVEAEKFFLYSLTVSAVGYNVAIAYDDGSASPPIVATTNIGKASHREYDVYALVGKNDFSDCVGQVVVGSLQDIDEIPPGQYFFAAAGGQLDPDAVVPSLSGITSLTVVNGNDRSDRIVGDVVLRAGTNMRITASIGDENIVTLSAINGEGLNEDCECNDLVQAPCIRRINGVGPDPNGDLDIGTNSCLEIVAQADLYLLTIKDICSTPCCGCKELDAINAQLNLFGDAKTTLANTANRLEAQQTQFHLVVLGSKLGDTGCEQC